MKKKNISLWVIIAVLIFSIIILLRPAPETDKQVAQCIGKNARLYSQLGCSHCKTQEELFGLNYNEITVVDCYYDQEECLEKNIRGTPTWIIDNKQYPGVQSIEKLKNLTGC